MPPFTQCIASEPLTAPRCLFCHSHHGALPEDSWKIVHPIRHLKELTPEQLVEMKALNPKSPDDIEEEKAEQEFLRGGAEQPGAPLKPAARPHRHQLRSPESTRRCGI